MPDWDVVLRSSAGLSPRAARDLEDSGFVLIRPELGFPNMAPIQRAYDRAITGADPNELSIRSSTRLHDLVNRGMEFDGIYTHSLLLAAAAQIIDQPFKLSSLLARTLEPGAPIQPLHVDVRRAEDAWPLAGFIVMVDEFNADNGATRFIPGSHRRTGELDEPEKEDTPSHGHALLACGQAGSIIVFDGSIWHGHTANRSSRPRRSIQGAFIPCHARAATEQSVSIRPETLARISEFAKYLLNVPHRAPN